MTDRDAIALTLYGEARGEGITGLIAVACVLRNRLRSKRWGHTYADVCLYPKQFSCWNVSDPNRARLLALLDSRSSDPVLAQCYTLAEVLLQEPLIRQLADARHYFADSIDPPAWAASGTVVARVGAHQFLEGVA
jgi:N-acetylmuramoyl-L-alanine amidase